MSAAKSLGWIYSGSMEALTLAPADCAAVDDVLTWFTQHFPKYRFSLYLF